MADQRVIRIPRSDKDDGSILLLHVSRTGQSPLDVRLTATEQEHVYVHSLRHKKIAQLQNHRYKGSSDDWEAVLRVSLLRNQNELRARHKDVLQGVELVAEIKDDGNANIAFLKTLESGIKQRLGEISLKQNDDQEVDLFAWLDQTLKEMEENRDTVSDLNAENEAQALTIKKLNDQIADFIKAKEEHENAMLQKFCVLLNNKKLKIRDQQRLLATAKVDPDAAAQVSSSRGGARTRKAGASRTGKRKANEANAVPESEGDPGESDHRKAENELDEDMEAATTPERTDDKTADEDEDDIAPEGDLPEGIGASKGKSAVRSGLEDSRNSSSPEAPPPRRDLPFAKHKTRQSAPEPVKEAPKAAASTNNGDESTDDDEL